MRRPHTVVVAVVTLLALVAAMAAMSMKLVEPTSAGEPTPGIIFHIDCNTTTAGVQDQCTYPTGTTQVDVDVVVENNTGAAFDLGAFGFKLISDHAGRFFPTTPSCDAAGRDCNPNFNQAELSATSWVCNPPPPNPDIDPSPTTSVSFIECFTPGPPPTGTLADGAFLKLATTQFNITGDVTVPFALTDASMFDENFNELGTCPMTAVAAQCNTASAIIGTGAAPTSTPTTTSTPTPTATTVPQMTPSGTPTGAVTDVLVLNQSVCIGASSAVVGLQAIDAALGCQGMTLQDSLQRFLTCLGGSNLCPGGLPSGEIFLSPEPGDFAAIDVDGDSIQSSQPLLVIAFVDARYPVLFETDQGTFLSHDGIVQGQSVLCYGAEPGAFADPDCFADTARPGDGVVVKRLFMNDDPYRGHATVRVTQNGVPKQVPFTITGIARTLSFTSIDGRTEIQTGAGLSGPAATTPDADACDRVVDGGSMTTSAKKTNVFVQAFDDDGIPVTGALVRWDKVFPFPRVGITPRQRDTRSPQGGAASPAQMTWNFDGYGLGSILVACGGDAVGQLNVVARFDPVLNVGVDEDYRGVFSVPVDQPAGAPPVGYESEDGIVGLNLGWCHYQRPNPDACGNLTHQGSTSEASSMQATLCLLRACDPNTTQIILDGSPDDFVALNTDNNRLSPEQEMAVIGFVPSEGPVTFTTNKGFFLTADGVPLGTTYTCTNEDPDCVTDSTLGDGIVTAYLSADDTTEQGDGLVTMTQGAHSEPMSFKLIGRPASLTVEAPLGEPVLNTHDRPCSFPYVREGIIDRAQRGYAEDHLTTRIIHVRDSEGEDVVGELIEIDPIGPELPTFITTTMVLGEAGIGALAVFCGQLEIGTFDFDIHTNSLEPRLRNTLRIKVGFQSCSGDQDCDFVPDLIDNCVDEWNPDQANNDGNFIDNSPPYAPVADDRTRADSDVYGDACDTDDDNDDLSDNDELGRSLCRAASGPTDPIDDDTDRDMFLDGAECAIGTDPLDAASKPPLSDCGPSGALSFGILNAQTAFCLFGTSANALGDSDSDLASDGSHNICEIVSLNADRIVNVADMGMLAFGITRSVTLANIDLNRDGVVNPADQGSLAAVMSSHACPIRFN